MKFLSIILSFAVLALSACGKTEKIPYASPALADGQVQAGGPAQPQQVQQQSQPTGWLGMLAAGGIGYMLGNSGSRNQTTAIAAPPTTVIHQTIVRKTVVVDSKAPKTASTPPAPAAPAPATAPKLAAQASVPASSFKAPAPAMAYRSSPMASRPSGRR